MPPGKGSPESARSTPCCSRFYGTAVLPCKSAVNLFREALLASIRIEWGPCRPTQKRCSPLRLASYCTVIMLRIVPPH